MKINYKKLGSIAMLALFCFGIIISSCKKEEKDPDPPTIPPLSTFQMETKALDSTNTSKSLQDIETYTNYWNAAARVWVWNVVLVVNLALPVAAFAESFNHEAVYQGNSTWTWSYTFWSVYTAKLEGAISGDNVNWKMYLSKNNVYSDKLWYSGTSKIDGTSGTWNLNYNEANTQPFIDIAWHRNANGTSDIKYTNVIPGNPGNGGHIFYGITADTDYDAFYEINNTDPAVDNFINIEWNRTNHNGHYKDTKATLGDTLWHCWDTTYVDVTCTP